MTGDPVEPLDEPGEGVAGTEGGEGGDDQFPTWVQHAGHLGEGGWVYDELGGKGSHGAVKAGVAKGEGLGSGPDEGCG